ncbi:heparan-alpha-glucosaminide N-acetyltransferase domain-containing protein [Agromyces laixinhei]|uniref:heparan-alpha-glucosaminide N-acetyltransferase domain-containing protein n=1 Tax=Agromyces laixinhei TaxID=2585717 RepID=UPI0012ED7EA3|nr:heparan-alpha-glucosaminide N-acetyltransferase domain-containing protein [Agromyces laixinhei]
MTRDATHLDEAAATARTARRLDGVDAARGLALIGMFVAHVAPAATSADLESLISIADERPRLLFALTAGMALAFISGGTRPIVTGRGRLRRQIAIRAVILIALGLLIAATLHPLVFIILDVYGVAFLILLPLLFIPARAALGFGIALLAVMPGLAEFASTTEPVIALQQGPYAIVVDWFVSGAYPVVEWVPVMLVGLGLARLGLTSRRVVATAALWGAAAAVVLLPIVAMMPAPVPIGGVAVTGDDRLVSALRTSLEAVGNVGVGVVVVAGMLLLSFFARPTVRRVAGAVLSPITAMGSMPLSIYTLHLVVLAASIRIEDGFYTDDSLELMLGLIIGSMVFAWLWRRFLGRGPLERVLRWASGRSRADAAVRQN